VTKTQVINNTAVIKTVKKFIVQAPQVTNTQTFKTTAVIKTVKKVL
jgi:hypothetical protein